MRVPPDIEVLASDAMDRAEPSQSVVHGDPVASVTSTEYGRSTVSFVCAAGSSVAKIKSPEDASMVCACSGEKFATRWSSARSPRVQFTYNTSSRSTSKLPLGG